MGQMVDGKWSREPLVKSDEKGAFVRPGSSIRNSITANGAAGPTGDSGFKAEAGRYHLYVSLACPWAHRALIYRALKGLEAMIPISVVNWFMGEDGWNFAEGPGVVPDPINNAKFLHEVYAASDAHYSGRVTVPVLWDRMTNRIVNNESSEIIRMLNSAFDGVGAKEGDYYPMKHRVEIDALNARIYETLNNGVYRAGFATSQQAYEDAVVPMFETLDFLDHILSSKRYLLGDATSEADWRLFPTLVRFDPVYYGHFKCNIRRIVDYPNLSSYLRDLYQTPGVAGTVNFQHIKGHYYQSHRNVNPSGIVPMGPAMDLMAPHGRAKLSGGQAN
jgi:putative glutathione S-transferase